MSLSIQPLTDDLLDEADRVLMAAFRSPSRRDELAFYQSLQPNAWLVATMPSVGSRSKTAAGSGARSGEAVFSIAGTVSAIPLARKARYWRWACAPVAHLDRARDF